MKLTTSNAEAALAAVRALAEGRAEKRALLTVPFTAFRAPLAKAEYNFDDVLRPLGASAGRRHFNLADQWPKFCAKFAGQEFVSTDFAHFVGKENTGVGSISAFVHFRAKKGEIVFTGRKNAQAKIWRFA
jgi:hypothetical protein